MLNIPLIVAPIFLLILIGHGLGRVGFPDVAFWSLSDRLAYWVLVPALLFSEIAGSEVRWTTLGGFTTVLLGSFLIAVAFALAAGRLLPMNGATASSVLQGSARHNIFIALAVAEHLFGAGGAALLVLGVAVLIPVTNVVVVVLVVALTGGSLSARSLRTVAWELATNPLLIAVSLGLLAKLGPGEIPILKTAETLGRAALPIVLLSIGANLRVRTIGATSVATVASLMGKFVVFPAAALVLAYLLRLPPLEALVALLIAAAPTATSSYVVARQLGGDAPLMAEITTLQTIISAISLPVTLELGRRILAP